MSEPAAPGPSGVRRLRGAVLTHARGPVVVSAGALLLGIGAYVFLTLAARSLGVAAFGDLSTLWALLFGFVAGLWYPFEQVLTKLLAVTGGGRRSDVRRVAVIQAVMLGVIQLAVVIALLASSNTLLGHDPWLAGGLLISVASLAAASYQRGLLVGARRYGWAAAQQAFDGATRGIGAVILAVVGADVGAYGVLLGLAPLVGVAAALAGTPRGYGAGAPRAWRGLLHDVLTLLAGTYTSIVLLNVGPLVVRALGTAEDTGRFMAVFVVARLPLFFAPPVVAGLLPTLVRAHETGSPEQFRRMVRATAGVVGGAVAVACLALGLAGPWIARTFFGAEYSASLAVSVLLALSSAGFVVAMVLQGALVAAGHPRAVVRPWLVAAVAFVVLCLVPVDIELRVAVAYLLSSAVALGAMAAAVWRASPARASADVPGRPSGLAGQ